MNRFLSNSFLLIVLISCSSMPKMDGYREVSVEGNEIALNPYFSDATKDHIYKAQISIYGKKLSGIFALKKINDTLQRAALMSEFGTTLLDVSYGKTYSKLNFCMEELQKKYILNTLIEDFRLLTISERNVEKIFRKEETQVLKSPVGNDFVYYFFEGNPPTLVKLIKTGKRNKKVSVYFQEIHQNRPRKIVIEHHQMNLEIILNATPETYVD